MDDDGKALAGMPGDDEEGRFQSARTGDHLLLTFQCELCHFRNMAGRNPDPMSLRDRECLLYCRRANLDAFWSREPATSVSNLRECVRTEASAEKLGIPSITPPMGPFPLQDDLGMRAALAVLDRSQDATGITEKYVQPSTYRKSQACITNVYRAGASGLGDQVGANDARKVWMSSCSTHTPWFARFMMGIKKRTGEVVKQDKAISIDLLHAVLNLLDDKWKATEDPAEKMRISRTGAWYSSGFCTALRGEEMVLVELAGTKNSLEKLDDRTKPTPYFALTVTGRTKMDRRAGAKFKIPCAGTTEGTGLKPGRWMRRYCESLKRAGRQTGYLFSTRADGSKIRLGDMEDDFFEPLEEIQEARPDLIPPNVAVREEYGIWRSLRRGVTAHALNMKVSESLVNLINRWRDDKKSGVPSGSMINVYTELEALLPTTIRYSLSL